MKELLRKVLCAGLVAAVMTTTAVTASAASVADFTDVMPTAWYYNAVDYAARESLFSGTGNGKFSPEAPMTRGMFVTVLGRLSGVSDAKPIEVSFSDVNPSDWFAPYVEWAAKYEIVSGTGNGKFAPDRKISREQMAAVLYRYAKLIGAGDNQNGTEILKFPDTGDVADYAKEAMTWAVDKEILKGADGRLDPKGTATRAQVAQVFLNAKDVLIKTELAVPRPGESVELAAVRLYLDENLPPECQWSEEALNGGWVGPMRIQDGGKWHGVQYYGAEYVATYCMYMLTEIDGFHYPLYYIKETPEGFYLYYA